MNRLPSKPWIATALAALLTFQQGLFIAQALEVSAPDRPAPITPAAPVLSLPALELPASGLPAAAPLQTAPIAPARAMAPAAPARPPVAAPMSLPQRLWNRLAGRRAAPAGRATESTVSQLFDGSVPPADDGSPRVFLVREDRSVARATVNTLAAALRRDPAFARRLNAKGLVRLVLAAKDQGALKRADAPAVEARLQTAGLTARVDVEKLALKPARAAKTEGPRASQARGGLLLRAVTWPARQAAYLARAFAAALDKPTKSELLGGLASKGPAFALSAVWWIAKLWPAVPLEPKMKELPALVYHVLASPWHAPAHPVALAAVLALSLGLETFHGIWIATWQNFQNILAKQRGTAYQTVFNLSYMQSTGALFRLITWAAVAGTIAPWTLHYWRDMGVVTLVGTFIGTLGYQGLNEFYNKGNAKRWLRSLVQQGRDLFFLLGGVFFASGSMGVYWPLFLTAQTIDLSLYAFSRLSKPRPIAYVAEPALADAPDFAATYPVAGPSQRSGLRQALEALVNNPFSKVLVLAARKIGGLLRRPRR